LGSARPSGRLRDMQPAHAHLSILAAAERLGMPVTVHVGIGTDIIHMHKDASGAALGEGSLRDFRYFVLERREPRWWGVPELRICGGAAGSVPEGGRARAQSGISLDGLTTVNLDFVRLYRPQTNVVARPTAGVGRGYTIIGHHELMIPLLAAALVEGV
jgi:hypothetical protein